MIRGIFTILIGLFVIGWIFGGDSSTENKQASKEVDPQFKCLSAWDGSHSDFKRYIKKNMRDPESFDHRETKVTPVRADGTQTVIMTYAGKNGFGGMVVEQKMGKIYNRDCKLIEIL
jgi:hypothetical protein